MPKARREHKCVLCHQSIVKGSDYIYQRVTPWECAPDSDQMFFTFKAHTDCYKLWSDVGQESDWEMPPDADAWRQMTEGMRSEGAS